MAKDDRFNPGRRDFIKSAVALGLAAALPGLGFPGVASAQAGTVARLGIIPSMPLTPGQVNSGDGSNICSLIYDWLFRLEGAEQKFTPSLAESARPEQEAREWVISLRQGVKFHHGTELTAEDVVYTVNRWLDPSVGSGLKNLFNHVDRVEPAGKYEARFVLAKRDPDFLLKFLDFSAAILAHDFDNENKGNTMPSGTGPFRVVEHTPNQRMMLEKNPDYFIPGLPKVDRFEVHFINEVQAQLMALESGNVDIVRWVSFDQLIQYQNHPRVDLITVPLANLAPISFDCTQKPFDDPRVTKALRLVVDHQKIMETVAYGYGYVCNDDYVWPGSEWRTEVPDRKRDLAQARRLLAEAGHGDGFHVEIHCSSNRPPTLEMVLAFKDMAREAGIEVEVRSLAQDIFISQSWLKVPAMCASWGHRENPLDLLNVLLRSDASWNESKYNNPELDRLLDLVGQELDRDRRKAGFRQIQTLLAEDGPGVLPFFYNGFGATNKRVKGYLMTRNFISDYRYVEVA
ncbi:MAG: ABC transporter substrate-binding protein [Deltaproteobacteria bacterium]|jgi:peptide/nickel transport system substrate-binding protein|nr:ABC transporter substrate-binding protein [Deltaproteobacteria bacterium]